MGFYVAQLGFQTIMDHNQSLLRNPVLVHCQFYIFATDVHKALWPEQHQLGAVSCYMATQCDFSLPIKIELGSQLLQSYQPDIMPGFCICLPCIPQSNY